MERVQRPLAWNSCYLVNGDSTQSVHEEKPMGGPCQFPTLAWESARRQLVGWSQSPVRIHRNSLIVRTIEFLHQGTLFSTVQHASTDTVDAAVLRWRPPSEKAAFIKPFQTGQAIYHVCLQRLSSNTCVSVSSTKHGWSASHVQRSHSAKVEPVNVWQFPPLRPLRTACCDSYHPTHRCLSWDARLAWPERVGLTQRDLIFLF